MKFSIALLFCVLLPVILFGVAPALSDDDKEDSGSENPKDVMQKIFEESMALIKDHLDEYREKAGKHFEDTWTEMETTAGKETEESWQKLQDLMNKMKDSMEGSIKETREKFQDMMDEAKKGYEDRHGKTIGGIDEAISKMKQHSDTFKKKTLDLIKGSSKTEVTD